MCNYYKKAIAFSRILPQGFQKMADQFSGKLSECQRVIFPLYKQKNFIRVICREKIDHLTKYNDCFYIFQKQCLEISDNKIY